MHRALVLSIMVLSLLGSACGSGPGSRQSCESRMKELQAWTLALLAEETGVWASPHLVEVNVKSDPPLDHGSDTGTGNSFTMTLAGSEPRPMFADLDFSLQATQVKLEGTPAWQQGQSASLSHGLEQLFARDKGRLEMIAKSRNERVTFRAALFAIAPQTPWSLVVEVYQFAQQHGFEQARFVFTRKPSVARPPKTWVDDAYNDFADNATIDMHPELTKAVFLAEQTRKALNACPELVALFDKSQGQMPTFAPPPETASCACTPDIDALRSVFWLSHFPSTGTEVAAWYPRSEKNEHAPNQQQTLRLAANTPWSVAYKHVIKAARRSPQRALVLLVEP